MATPRQIAANRQNAQKSTGPKSPSGKDVTKFNGLKHGLCAEQVVLPGEDPAESEAERKGWLDDWKPWSHTRAVLVERAAAASWRLRRSVRAETTRLRSLASAAGAAFDAKKRDLIGRVMGRLDGEPEALALARTEPAALDHLIGVVDGLLAALAAPAGWADFRGHHGRLFSLLGHPVGTEADAIGELANFSVRLLPTNDPEAVTDPGGPLTEEESEYVADELRDHCAELRSILVAERSRYLAPAVARARAVEAASVDTSKEAELAHRYEMAHDRSLRATVNQLMALHRSGADLVEEAGDETETPAPLPVAPMEAVAPTEANPPEPGAPTEANSVASERSNPPTEADFEAPMPLPTHPERDRDGRTWPVAADPSA